MSFYHDAAKASGSTYMKSWTSGNGWQGTTYYLYRKNGLFALPALSFGTCAFCDAVMGLEEDWYKEHGNHEFTEETYLPVVRHLTDNMKWVSRDALLAEAHMIFGVGLEDVAVEKEITTYLKEEC